jgi:RNA polymerase sigma factor (sigma-70 family)
MTAPDNFPALVSGIRAGEPDAMVDLYRILKGHVRLHLCRQLGVEDLEDRVHDLFLTLVDAIQRGAIRQPERLMGYVWTVVRRAEASGVRAMLDGRRAAIAEWNWVPDWRPNPQAQTLDRERSRLLRRILAGIGRRDREILVRFYLEEQTQAQIRREMGLSPAQFRLNKSRAKARLVKLARAHQRSRGTLRSRG